MRIRPLTVLVLVGCALSIASPVRAQIDTRLVLDPYPEGAFAITNDHVLFQTEGDVNPEHDKNAQVFRWESDGRFRFSKTDPSALAIGYRWTTMNFDTNSDVIPEHLDDVGLAFGFHVGQIADGDVAVVLGMGYTGDNPFDNETGIYGSGHMTWQHAINKTDSLALSVDYQGDQTFLPDVPLPGFQYIHRDETLSFGFGYPRSWAHWVILDSLELDANYAVPYTGDVTLTYRFTKTFSVFGQYANSFEGFVASEQDATNRIFLNMSRAEVGIRYCDPNFMQKFFLDASLALGYAFEQNFSSGFDVRDNNKFSSISDEPYIGLLLVGRF
jgi:hypothetical protein